MLGMLLTVPALGQRLVLVRCPALECFDICPRGHTGVQLSSSDSSLVNATDGKGLGKGVCRGISLGCDLNVDSWRCHGGKTERIFLEG